MAGEAPASGDRGRGCEKIGESLEDGGGWWEERESLEIHPWRRVGGRRETEEREKKKLTVLGFRQE